MIKPIGREIGVCPRLLAGIAALCISACTTTPTVMPVQDRGEQLFSGQTHRLEESSAALDALQELDVLIRFNNDALATIIRDGLAEELTRMEDWSTQEIRVEFLPQYIAIEVAGARRGSNSSAGMTLKGDTSLRYQAGRLWWQPQFARADMVISETETTTIEASEDNWLDNFNIRLGRSLRSSGVNVLEIDPIPMGILETGIRLRAPFESVISESSPLSGELTTAGSAVLVEEDVTSVALDLGFVPGLQGCEASVSLGRATFTERISNREPVGPVAEFASRDSSGVFFSEVMGAREPTAIVHYWFADGQPASVSELEVQPSARWRTWSARPEGNEQARLWEVLVVEKTTGCILESHAVFLTDPVVETVDVEQAQLPTVDSYTKAFYERLGAESLAESTPQPAEILISQLFFRQILSEAMYDLRLISRSTVQSQAPVNFDARLEAVEVGDAPCVSRQCRSDRACTINYDNCPVQRDNRDCTSCLFRNPLNNRCMNEAEDPICVAARDTENTQLAEKRNACIRWETALRDACQSARDRDIANCREMAAVEVEACQAQVEELSTLGNTFNPVARITGQAELGGDLVFEFSGFRLEDSLERLRMDVGLTAELDMAGRLAFAPSSSLGPLGRCLESAEEDFNTQLTLPRWQSGMAADLKRDEGALEARWSSLVQSFEVDPPPVHAFFEANRNTFLSCEVDLDPQRFPASLTGPGTQLLRGALELEIQPLPTRITLLPAYLKLGETEYSGEAEIGQTFVRYPFTEISMD